jgi:hypothetical protein
MRLAACVAAMFLALAASAASMAQTAGKFIVAVGDVKLVGKDGNARTAERGSELREGDTIVTGANGLAQLRLQDNSLISVRANTEMKLDKFAFAGETDSNASLFISLAKGGLRSITGLIGKANRAGYRINTPVATIGIRGTDHEPFYIPPNLAKLGTPGTYDKVNSGMTVIQAKQGPAINVTINQVAYVPLSGAAPVILPSVPAFFKQELAVPDPQARKAPATDSAPAADTGTAGSDTAAAPAAAGAGDASVKAKAAVATTPLTAVRAVATPIDKTLGPATSVIQATPLSAVGTDPATLKATTILDVTPAAASKLQATPLSASALSTSTVQQFKATAISPITTVTPITPVSPITTVSPLTTVLPILVSPLTTVTPMTTVTPTTTLTPLSTTPSLLQTAPLLKVP